MIVGHRRVNRCERYWEPEHSSDEQPELPVHPNLAHVSLIHSGSHYSGVVLQLSARRLLRMIAPATSKPALDQRNRESARHLTAATQQRRRVDLAGGCKELTSSWRAKWVWSGIFISRQQASS